MHSRILNAPPCRAAEVNGAAHPREQRMPANPQTVRRFHSDAHQLDAAVDTSLPLTTHLRRLRIHVFDICDAKARAGFCQYAAAVARQAQKQEKIAVADMLTLLIKLVRRHSLKGEDIRELAQKLILHAEISLHELYHE